MSKKPVLLCIMDGFGWTPDETYGNAVAAAKKPFLDSLMAKYPMTTIEASGMAVGLPDGQMGNSEVGHTNMGAGRIVYQQLTLITKSIKDGEMLQNPVLVKNMKAAIDAGKAIHLMGLVGTGGVHSHADHWFGVLEMAKHLGAKDVYLHCITDGRDTDPHSGKGFLADLQAKLDELGIGKIASVSGRYYAMDRDNNWDREEKAYAAFVYGEGEQYANAAEAIEASYANDKTDEFVLPCVTCEGGRVQDGDTVLWFEGTTENRFQGPTLEQLRGEIIEWVDIASVADLLALAKSSNDGVLAKNYRLTADLDLSGVDFPGIGTAAHPFTGLFDGQGHTVTGVTVSGTENVGFFGVIKGATIKNLHLADVTVTGEKRTGGLVGYAQAELDREIAKLEKKMKEAAKMMEFEYAAVLRDEIIRLRTEADKK